MEKDVVLSIQNIRKSFPGVVALDDVSFDIIKGEVHAIVGENGAGKSTLMKILSGVYQKDSGKIVFEGKEVSFKNPLEGYKSGISIIFQELNLVPSLSIAENIFVGRLKSNKLHKITWNKIYEDAEQYLKKVGCQLNPRQKVSELSVAEKQMVEIAKALSFESKVIIMDEPTASLTNQEIDKLFEIIANLKKDGVTVLYISHRLEEIVHICDRVTVFRDGKWIDTRKIKDLDKATIINLMVGRTLGNEYPAREVEIGAEILRVENISTNDKLRNIKFSVRKGEVVGIAGLVGSGRTELARALFGADKISNGKIFLKNREIKLKGIPDAINNGIALVTEDRKWLGLALSYSAAKNVTMAKLSEVTKNGLIDVAKENEICETYIKKLKIAIPSSQSKVGNLSGGNQQKVVLAKWLLVNSDILILDEPTRGIDVGAKYEIYQLINDFVSQGKAVIMISSELPEIIGMSDRIIVMHEGCVKGEFLRKEVTQEKIMQCAIG